MGESTPRPDNLTDDKVAIAGVELNGNQWEFLAGLIRPQNHVPAADFEPANHRIAIGSRRNDLAVELARIGHRAIDGHDRAGGQYRMHGFVSQSHADRFAGIGQPASVRQHVSFGRARSRIGSASSRQGIRARSPRTQRLAQSGTFSGATITVSREERSSSSRPRLINSTGVRSERSRS